MTAIVRRNGAASLHHFQIPTMAPRTATASKSSARITLMVQFEQSKRAIPSQPLHLTTTNDLRSSPASSSSSSSSRAPTAADNMGQNTHSHSISLTKPYFGQAIVPVAKNSNLAQLKTAIVDRLRVYDPSNNPYPLLESQEIIHVVVYWDTSIQPARTWWIDFPLCTMVTEENCRDLLTYLSERPGYDFIGVLWGEREDGGAS